MIARIIKIVSREYTLLDDEANRYEAILMGKVRKQDRPVAGDMVEAEFSAGRWVIQKILPRKNRLVRPACANIDQAMIVMSVKDPDFSPALVDRLSILIMKADVEPVLVITKTDLPFDDSIEERIREYERGRMKTIRTNAKNLSSEIEKVLNGKVTVLTGQSGAGKSTLLNTIEPSFNLQTQEISKALGRGKHTTRHNELHEVAGGLVADTPGFSSLEFGTITAAELGECVPDFVPYIGKCRFNDCIHQNEPDCAVKEAVSAGHIAQVRYADYLDVLQIIQNRKEKYI